MSEATTTFANKIITVSVIGANGSAVVAGNELLTAAGLEQLNFLGITYGAWVMMFLFASLLIVIVLNIKKLWVEILAPLMGMVREHKAKSTTL